MTFSKWLTAIVLGLTGAIGMVGAAADTHDDDFLYEIYSGLRPPTSPGELQLTEGWHGDYTAELYRALDFVHPGAGGPGS